MPNFKVYNVNVWDINWCDEHYLPKSNIPTEIENYTASAFVNSTDDDVVNEILSQLESDKAHELGCPIYIASAKIKINDWYFFTNTIEGI